MLSAAAFSMSSDRGELLRSNVTEFLDIQKFCNGKSDKIVGKRVHETNTL